MFTSAVRAVSLASKKPSPRCPAPVPKPIKMPTEMTFVNRLQWGFASVLAGFNAEAHWRALIAPWVRGEYVAPPP